MLGILFRNVASAIVVDVSTGGVLDTITQRQSVCQALCECLEFGKQQQ